MISPFIEFQSVVNLHQKTKTVAIDAHSVLAVLAARTGALEGGSGVPTYSEVFLPGGTSFVVMGDVTEVTEKVQARRHAIRMARGLVPHHNIPILEDIVRLVLAEKKPSAGG